MIIPKYNNFAVKKTKLLIRSSKKKKSKLIKERERETLLQSILQVGLQVNSDH